MTIFLFTDIERSTELLEMHGSTMIRAMHTHEKLLRETIEEFGGIFIKAAGDGIFAAFETGDSLGCAVEMQRRLAHHDWGEVRELRVRIALHAGQAELSQGDYFGLEVSRTNRILNAAWGGQILISPQVLRACAMPAGATLIDHGAHILKDLSEPQYIYELRHPDLPNRQYPALRSISARAQNLPAQVTPFIGRDQELRTLASMLDNPDCRLITLVGQGGIGKTRLAIQAAANHLEKFTHGAYFVPLAPLTSSEMLVPAIADSLKFSFQIHEPHKIQLLNHLYHKNLLLVLDNFEHILDSVSIVTEILNYAPKVKILATSRERLHLQSETLLEIHGLTLPPSSQDPGFEYSDAIQLFVQNARRVHTKFALQDDEREPLVQICQLVDGLPLAIEIASAWSYMLSVKEIAQEINKGLDFFTTSFRDIPSRHRSLRAVFEYSWSLLADSEKQAFRRLSVFLNPFDRHSASQVAGVSLAQLTSLVNKSLIARNLNGKFEIHILLRQFAAEKLSDDPVEEFQTHQWHCAYFATLLASFEAPLRGPEQLQVAQELSDRIQDIHTAWDWATTHRDIAAINCLLHSLYLFYNVRGWPKEGDKRFSQALAALDPQNTDFPESALSRAHTRLNIRLAKFYIDQDLYERAIQILEHCLAFAQQMEDQTEIILALSILGHACWASGDHARADQFLKQGWEIASQIDSPHDLANVLSGLGVNAWSTGRYNQALQYFNESLEINRAIGGSLEIGMGLDYLGVVHRELGDYTNAKQLFEESIQILKAIGSRHRLAYALNHLASCLIQLGDTEAGSMYLEQSIQVGQENGDQRVVAYSKADLAETMHKAGRLSEAIALYQDAVNHFMQIGDVFGIVYSKYSLAESLSATGRFEQARFELLFALQKSIQANNQRLILETLLGIARWFQGDDQPDMAAQITGFILERPAKPANIIEQANHLKKSLELHLNADNLQVFLERGKLLTLEMIIKHIESAA